MGFSHNTWVHKITELIRENMVEPRVASIYSDLPRWKIVSNFELNWNLVFSRLAPIWFSLRTRPWASRNNCINQSVSNQQLSNFYGSSKPTDPLILYLFTNSSWPFWRRWTYFYNQHSHNLLKSFDRKMWQTLLLAGQTLEVSFWTCFSIMSMILQSE